MERWVIDTTCMKRILRSRHRRFTTSIVLKIQSLGFIFEIIVREHSDERGDFFDGMRRIGSNRLPLQPKQHHTIERIQASFYLAYLLTAFVPQFHNERQNLIIFGIVEREFRALQQSVVQFGKILHQNSIDL